MRAVNLRMRMKFVRYNLSSAALTARHKMTHRLVPRNVCVVAQFLGINILDLIDKDLINKEPFLFLKDSF